MHPTEGTPQDPPASPRQALRRETNSENQHVQRCHPPCLEVGETHRTDTALLLIALKSLFGAKT